MPGFGRLFRLDHRDARHLVRMVTPTTRPKRRTWTLRQRLDQGDQPQCVGYSFKHLLLARPKEQRKSPSAPEIYNGAQRFDGEPGENYAGTTVRGGAEYLKDEAKLIKSYRWAFSAEDALNYVGNDGPVVLGTDWKTDMMRPGSDGRIRFSGGNIGGHAYLLIGYDDRRQLALIHNSWGEDWGLRGRAWISYADLEQALRDAGEACAAVEGK